MGKDDRIVVDVDDSGVRLNGLGDLMGVVRGRDASADVQELPDASLGGQVPHDSGQERPVGPDARGDIRIGLERRVTGLAIGGIVIPAAQPVVVHPGDVGHAGVEGRPLLRPARASRLLDRRRRFIRCHWPALAWRGRKGGSCHSQAIDRLILQTLALTPPPPRQAGSVTGPGLGRCRLVVAGRRTRQSARRCHPG